MKTELQRAFKWLFGEDTGMSSKAIMGHMVAGVSDGRFPFDPDDLGRCLRLLDKFPEWEARIVEMSDYVEVWALYSRNWGALKESYLQEVGQLKPDHGARAPKTYALMKSLQLAASKAA